MTEAVAELPKPAAVHDVPVDLSQLKRVGARPPFLDYLVQLWDFRQFIYYDARARVQSGTRSDKLGSAWLILNPVFNGLTYFLVFGLLLNTSKGIPNFIGYLVIGVFM
ncbi:MAG: ABC transporter permease, partial [Specibacter sp.]